MRFIVLFFYKCLFVLQRQKRVKGFTLLELLISVIIASLIMTGLLYGVVELTRINQRETNLDQVQRDMNRAMEYITDDLKEAVYVYPDPQQISTQLTSDPEYPDDVGEVPVLAFWRVDPLDENLPACVAGSPNFDQCQLLRIRQAAYTLVVYAQKVNDGNINWPGQSRLIRYELDMYSDVSNLTLRPGYRDPTDPDDPLAGFDNWNANGVPDGNADVLVDYVQAPVFATPVSLNRAPLSDAGGECRGYGVDDNNIPLYSVVPSTATTDVNNTFFACVRNPELDAGGVGSQDIYLFLRGNVQGVSGGVRSFSDATSLPIIETQVLVKGVVNKGFRQ